MRLGRGLGAQALILLFFSRTLLAGPGTTSGNFLKIAVGARPAAMGEANLALADDANALQWNPAGLAQLSHPELTLMHLSYFADINYEYVGFAMPWRGQGLGLGLTWMNIAPFNSTLDPAALPGSASDYSLSAAYALSLSQDLMVGAVGRTILSNLAGQSAFGASLDGGALFRPLGRSLTLALVAQNLGVQSAYESEADPLPITLRFGGAWHLHNAADQRWLNLVADLNRSLEGLFRLHLGAELWLFDLLALRGGYKIVEGGSEVASGGDAPADFTLGLGFRLGAAQLDYAFVPLGELGQTQRLSASWKFGYKPRSIEREKVLNVAPKFGTLADGRSGGVAFNLDPKKAFGDTPLRDWKVEIRDADGRLVRTLSGTGPAPRNLAWDLKAADGNLIDPSKPYRYAVTLRDWNGKSVVTDGFIAQEVKPREMMASSPSYDAASGGLVFRPRTGMTVGVREWKLNIRDAEGNILRTLSGTGAIPRNLVWRPEGDALGGDLLAGRRIQSIRYDLEFKDAGGRQAVVSDQVRFALGKAEERSYTLPLPLREFRVNKGNEILVAPLPGLTSADAASARNAPFVMPVPQAGQVRLWRFEITDASGRVVRTYRGSSELPENIFWDGRDEAGAAVPEPEKARFKLSVLGSQGERSTDARRAVRNPFSVQVAEGQIRKISGIWFRFLDSDIQDAVLGKLKEIALLLRRDPAVQVSIQGHAWDEGGDAEELRLSQERADAVLRYLIEQEGLSPRNVSAVGFGSAMPLSTGREPADADRNRRVEVILASPARR